MKLSKVFLVSIFITAVVLAMIGGLVANVFAAKSAPAQSNDAQIQAYKDREAEYNKLIEQANQQLDQANKNLKALQEQTVKQQVPAANQQPQTSVAVSEQKAAEIASQVAAPGQSLKGKPDLVDFQGKTAYEIPYDNGSVYVDAQNGTVLFNGTVPQEVTLEMATKIAEDFLKNKDIVKADEIPFRGAQIYRVIFKDSTIVYLDKTGQITYILRNSMVSRFTPDNSGGGNNSPINPPHHEDDHGDD